MSRKEGAPPFFSIPNDRPSPPPRAELLPSTRKGVRRPSPAAQERRWRRAAAPQPAAARAGHSRARASVGRVRRRQGHPALLQGIYDAARAFRRRENVSRVARCGLGRKKGREVGRTRGREAGREKGSGGGTGEGVASFFAAASDGRACAARSGKHEALMAPDAAGRAAALDALEAGLLEVRDSREHVAHIKDWLPQQL